MTVCLTVATKADSSLKPGGPHCSAQLSRAHGTPAGHSLIPFCVQREYFDESQFGETGNSALISVCVHVGKHFWNAFFNSMTTIASFFL